MNEKKKLPFFIYYLIFAAGVAGAVLILISVWIQTEGMTAEYISSFWITIAIIAGFALGVASLRYMRSRSKKSEEIGDHRHVIYPSDLKNMMIGYLVMEAVCLVLAFTATSVFYYLLAVGLGTFAVTAEIYFFTWALQWRKEEEAKEKK